MDTIGKTPFSEITIIITVAVLLALYGIYKLILILRKVKRQRAELKKLVAEYEEFLRNRFVDN